MSFFKKELEICEKIFNSHNEKKGDSYKTCDIDSLRGKLIREFKEWANYLDDDDGIGTNLEVHELADIINLCLMIIYRIKELDSSFQIRHMPGRCCPDYGCLYTNHDGKTCKYCDADCTKCIHNKPKEVGNLE